MSFANWLRIQRLRRANRMTCIVFATAVMVLIASNQAAAVDTESLNNSQLTADSLSLLLPGTAISNLASLGIEWGDADGDVDFFQTPLAAGEVLFGMVTPNTDLSWLGFPSGFITPDTIVSVFDDSGARTFNNQDYAAELSDTGFGNGSLFRFESPATSVYRIGVGGYSDLEFAGASVDPFNESGSYVLTAGRVNPDIPGGGFADTDPANQTAAGADLITVTPGTAQVAVLQLGDGDVDFFRLDLKEGNVLSTMTAPLGNPGVSFDYPDTLLGLFDSSGTDLLVVDDDAPVDFGASTDQLSDFPSAGGISGSALRALIPADGTYYLAVTGYGDDGFGGAHAEIGAYGLLVGVAAAVPEPSGALLAAVAMLACGLGRFDKRNRTA